MKIEKTLFLAWLDPNSRFWFPIGRLTFDGGIYKFVYTQGASLAQQQCGFEPLSSFPQFDKVYTSTQLFPVFSNRLMPRSRPDYSSFIQWLNIAEHEYEPIAILARSGGERETDTLTVFPRPEPDSQGRYHFHQLVRSYEFFLQGTQAKQMRYKTSQRRDAVATSNSMRG